MLFRLYWFPLKQAKRLRQFQIGFKKKHGANDVEGWRIARKWERVGEEGNGLQDRHQSSKLDILDILVIIELSPHNLSPSNSTLLDAFPSIRPSAVCIRLSVASSTFPPFLSFSLTSTQSLPVLPFCWPFTNFGHCLATLPGDCDYIAYRETDNECLIDRIREGYIGSQLASWFNSLSLVTREASVDEFRLMFQFPITKFGL